MLRIAEIACGFEGDCSSVSNVLLLLLKRRQLRHRGELAATASRGRRHRGRLHEHDDRSRRRDAVRGERRQGRRLRDPDGHDRPRRQHWGCGGARIFSYRDAVPASQNAEGGAEHIYIAGRLERLVRAAQKISVILCNAASRSPFFPLLRDSTFFRNVPAPCSLLPNPREHKSGIDLSIFVTRYYALASLRRRSRRVSHQRRLEQAGTPSAQARWT